MAGKLWKASGPLSRRPSFNFSTSGLLLFLLFSLPLTILPLSYLLLGIEHGTLNLWNRVVHENGRYTLAETVFYFDHFVREMPISLMTAFAAAGAFYLHADLKPSILVSPWRKAVKSGGTMLAGFLLFVFIGAVAKTGVSGFWLDLFQFKTTDPLVRYGSHWDFHFLHLLQIFMLSVGFAVFYRGISGRGSRTADPSGQLLLAVWGGIFILLTLIFLPSLEPFSDTRYLAHQFREIVTHSSVTLPLTFACLIALENQWCGEKSSSSSASCRRLCSRGLLILGSSFLVPVFILVQLRGRDILAAAQKQTSYADLLASHYFEHTLDYFFVPLAACLFYLIFLNQGVRRGECRG